MGYVLGQGEAQGAEGFPSRPQPHRRRAGGPAGQRPPAAPKGRGGSARPGRRRGGALREVPRRAATHSGSHGSEVLRAEAPAARAPAAVGCPFAERARRWRPQGLPFGGLASSARSGPGEQRAAAALAWRSASLQGRSAGLPHGPARERSSSIGPLRGPRRAPGHRSSFQSRPARWWPRLWPLALLRRRPPAGAGETSPQRWLRGTGHAAQPSSRIGGQRVRQCTAGAHAGSPRARTYSGPPILRPCGWPAPLAPRAGSWPPQGFLRPRRDSR